MGQLEELGLLVRDLREYRSWTQAVLGQKLNPPVSRTTIALLEQGRRWPAQDAMNGLSRLLGLPRRLWIHHYDPEVQQERKFTRILSEFVGRPLSLDNLAPEAVTAARQDIHALFGHNLATHQAYDLLNQLLVYFGLMRLSRAFFDRYFDQQAFLSLDRFQQSILQYQHEAIRLFSTFPEAYQAMNQAEDLKALLSPLAPKDLGAYTRRRPWTSIQEIPEQRLPDLGYISAAIVRQELKEREVLSQYLRSLASAIRERGAAAVTDFGEKKRRTVDALLRKFDTQLPHGPISPLFFPDPSQLLREAERIAPKGQGDLERIALTQQQGLQNLSGYLTADHMDVYIATSMRTQADFISVNRFVQTLFQHRAIQPLHLRYFNPTQSWIQDRVAKGLVEAMMLKRADYAIYMAQKSDTFGKDSEASVALGQGKPVIVYVPKLSLPGTDIDTASLSLLSEEQLKQNIRHEGSDEQREIDDTLDHEGLHAQLLTIRMHQLSDAQLCEAVARHWADFDLYAEAERIREPEIRTVYTQWLDLRLAPPSPTQATMAPELPLSLRDPLIRILVAVAMRFERRAKVFREIHPLALQVILSSGVLNGMLVARSIEVCAVLLRQLIENKLHLRLAVDHENYRLIEETTHSTVRVISRHPLLTHAFQAFYKRDAPLKPTPS